MEDRRSDAVAHLAVRVRSQNTGLFRAFLLEFMKTLKNVLNKIQYFSQLCKGNHLDSHSAAAAFFMFVAIIPFVILILAIIPYTPLTDSDILGLAEMLLPDRLDSFAVDIMNQLSNQSLTVLSVSALFAMWTASRSVMTIKQGLNEINGDIDTRNFLVNRGFSALYTLILIVSFMLILILNVVFVGVDRYVKSIIDFSIIDNFSIVNVIMKLRPFITVAIGFLLNLYFFTILPKRKMKVKEQVPGAIIVSVVWYLYSLLFGIYISKYNAYSMYGSLAVVIIVLIWLYACMYILFLGAQFNYYLSVVRKNNKI